jgi:hypothetical protein
MRDGAGDMRDSGTRARAGPMKLVACEAVIEDLGGIRPEIPREIVDMSLHERPGKLRDHLQDIIDASAGSWDKPGGTVKLDDLFDAGATGSPRAGMLTAGTPTGGGEHAVGDR